MRGKISCERERSLMYTMGMMSPAGARYLVHGLRVIRIWGETPCRAELSQAKPIWPSVSSPYPVTDSDTWLLRWRASSLRYRKSRRALGSRERERRFTRARFSFPVEKRVLDGLPVGGATDIEIIALSEVLHYARDHPLTVLIDEWLYIAKRVLSFLLLNLLLRL